MENIEEHVNGQLVGTQLSQVWRCGGDAAQLAKLQTTIQLHNAGLPMA